MNLSKMKWLLIFKSPDWLSALCSHWGKTDLFQKALVQIHHVKHFPCVIELYQPGKIIIWSCSTQKMTGTNSEWEQFPSNFVYPGSCRMLRMLQFEAVSVALLWCQAMAVLMAPERSFPCSRGSARSWSAAGIQGTVLWKSNLSQNTQGTEDGNNFHF